jgi:hypothetical protein
MFLQIQIRPGVGVVSGARSKQCQACAKGHWLAGYMAASKGLQMSAVQKWSICLIRGSHAEAATSG